MMSRFVWQRDRTLSLFFWKRWSHSKGVTLMKCVTKPCAWQIASLEDINFASNNNIRTIDLLDSPSCTFSPPCKRLEKKLCCFSLFCPNLRLLLHPRVLDRHHNFLKIDYLAKAISTHFDGQQSSMFAYKPFPVFYHAWVIEQVGDDYSLTLLDSAQSITVFAPGIFFPEL